MILRSVEDNNLHNRMIMAVVRHLMSQGYEVHADHIGYPNGKPEEWRGQRPDICAIKGNRKLYVEAETCESLNNEETKVQWVVLNSNKDASFCIIIPEKCKDQAINLATKWGVKISSLWAMPV